MGAVWGKITSSVCKCDAKPPASSNNSKVPGSVAPNMPKNNNNNKNKNKNKNRNKNVTDPKYIGQN